MPQTEPVFAIAPALFNSLGIYIYSHHVKPTKAFSEASLELVINQLARMNFSAVKAMYPDDTDYWSGLKGYHFNLTAARMEELAGNQLHLNHDKALQTLALIRESVGQLHPSGDTALMEELETSLKAQKSRPLSVQQTA